MIQPDQCHIDHALRVAAMSPCRSKRGVVLFNAQTGAHRGEGWNGPPANLGCPGRDKCAGNCGQRSVHAEVRALRDAQAVYARHYDLDQVELLHAELVDGGVKACGGPSCWQCAREILDVGWVAGVWLYERLTPMEAKPEERGTLARWRRYTAEEFYRATLERCGMMP